MFVCIYPCFYFIKSLCVCVCFFFVVNKYIYFYKIRAKNFFFFLFTKTGDEFEGCVSSPHLCVCIYARSPIEKGPTVFCLSMCVGELGISEFLAFFNFFL